MESVEYLPGNCSSNIQQGDTVPSSCLPENAEDSSKTVKSAEGMNSIETASAEPSLPSFDEEIFEDALDSLESAGCKVSESDVRLSDESSQPLHSRLNVEQKSDNDDSEEGSEAVNCSTNAETDDLTSNTNESESDVMADTEPDTQCDSKTEIDEAALREKEAVMTDEEKQARQKEALRLKEVGNRYFVEGHYESAVESYTDALAVCLICQAHDRAIIYSNRAAAKMRLENYETAIADCTKALEFNPDYMKALLRRAELHEKADKLDEALEDYTKALERDPSLHSARSACMRLPDQIKERNEKMKEEMISKLKDLGNMILRPFGLSTNNFKLQQDPNTGSYSVSFQQNAQQNTSEST